MVVAALAAETAHPVVVGVLAQARGAGHQLTVVIPIRAGGICKMRSIHVNCTTFRMHFQENWQ